MSPDCNRPSAAYLSLYALKNCLENENSFFGEVPSYLQRAFMRFSQRWKKCLQKMSNLKNMPKLSHDSTHMQTSMKVCTTCKQNNSEKSKQTLTEKTHRAV